MIAKSEIVYKLVNVKRRRKTMTKRNLEKSAKTELRLVERSKPEPYSFTIAVRVRKSEKDVVQRYAAKNGTNIDTVLRSALVAVGILTA